MRATDGLQTTINLGPVRDDQAFSLQLSLGMSLPVPSQDEHLPDQIEAFVHQAGLQIQHRLFRALIEKADQELVLQNRRGKAGPLVSSEPGDAAVHLQDNLGEVTVQRSRISHKHDDTIEVPWPGPGRHPTNCTSPGTSGMRSVISSAIDPRREPCRGLPQRRG